VALCYLANRRPDESLAALLDRIGPEPFAAFVQKNQSEQTLDRRDLATLTGASLG
jgi:hypothetical protein